MLVLRSISLSMLLGAGTAFAQLPNSARDLHEYDLIDVAWDVTLNPDTELLLGSVVNTVAATKPGARLIFDAADLRIRRVSVDGVLASFSSNGKVVEVVPPTPLKPKQKVAVQIDYAGRPEAGLYHVPGARAFPAVTDVFYTQGEMEDTRYWLPTYDFPNDKATSQGTIRVPAGWNVLSNGKLLSQSREDGLDVFRWRIAQPHATYLISLVAGPYTEVPDGKSPVPTSIFVPRFLESWGKQAFGGTDKVIQLYGKLTGFKYPYAKYSQAAVPDFMFGGMENITATTNTIGAIFPPTVGTARNSEGLVAHELAHQWFGDTVTTPEWKHIWINEGWATFLPLFWEREKRGEDGFASARLDVIEGALGAMRQSPKRPMVYGEYKDPIELFDGFAYAGGAARMVSLMHYLGESDFWKATQSYLKRSAFQNVDTERFFAEFKRSSGKDLDFFRKQWFYTPSSSPKLVAKKSGADIVLESSPLFQGLPIDVWLIDSAGKVEKTKLTPDSEKTVIPNVNGRRVLVDPEVWALAEVSYDLGYAPADWQALWAAAPNVAQKTRLRRAVWPGLNLEQKKAAYAAETYVPFKADLVRGINDPAFLLEISRSDDPNLVVAALNAFGKDQVGRAKEIFDSSANDEVKKVAANRWLSLSDSVDVAKALLKVTSYDESIRGNALSFLATKSPDLAREQALEWVLNPKNEALRVSAINVLGQVKDKPGERRVVNALLPILRERSNGALSAAIEAAQNIGDPAFLFPLYLRRDHSLHFTRKAIQGALESIQARKK